MSSASSGGNREAWLVEEANLYGFVRNDPIDKIDADGRFVPVLLIFSTGKAISNGILACYDCYQLSQCEKRTKELIDKAAKGITDPEEYLKWLNAAKPGAECAPLLAACGKDVLMVAVWAGGRYLLLKYYAGGSY
jgi:hypothetical protein